MIVENIEQCWMIALVFKFFKFLSNLIESLKSKTWKAFIFSCLTYADVSTTHLPRSRQMKQFCCYVWWQGQGFQPSLQHDQAGSRHTLQYQDHPRLLHLILHRRYQQRPVKERYYHKRNQFQKSRNAKPSKWISL